MSLLSNTVQPVSEEFIRQLNAAFRTSEVTPDTEINKIMYEAGQQSVLTWINHWTSKNRVVGAFIDPLGIQERPPSNNRTA